MEREEDEMAIPTAVSLKVVEHDGKKMFLMPKEFVCHDPFEKGTEISDGLLKQSIWVMHFSSYDDYNREVDTPCILFRKGQYFDHGILEYLFGQDSGYLVWDGFKRLKTDNPCDPHIMYANYFEVGDIITFVQMPRPDSKVSVRQ